MINNNGFITMDKQSSKRTFDEISSDADNLSASKHLKNSTIVTDNIFYFLIRGEIKTGAVFVGAYLL